MKEIKIKLEFDAYNKLKTISDLEKKEPEKIIEREVKGYIQMKEEELKSLSFTL